MDILDRQYAKKLFNGLSSGYLSSSVTSNADGSKTLTINFVNGDKAEITFSPVKGDKGDKGTSVKDVKIQEISGVRHLIITLDDNTEIDGGILPNEQYDDTQVKADIAKLKLDKQDKTDNGLDTTDKTVIGAINEVNGNQLDTVGFSADYKNIILNRKNGLNPYIIPIASIIHNAKLIELNDIDSTDIGNGKTLIYDSATQKHKYVDSTGTDELVKMEASTDAKYLSELIDKSTIVNDNGTLKVKQLDGQNVTIAEINHLKGLTMNVMDLVNMFSNGGVKIINTPVSTYADLLTYDKTSLIDGISYLVYVLADETHDNAKTTYLIDKTSSTPTYFGFAGEHRDFTTNPINLANEVTGKLGTSNIDVDSLWSLLTINDTYKTLTTNNEIFGTHGAKAMYDELVTSIGNKANQSDLDTHTNDTDIHVSTTDKEKWDKVTEKANKTDFDTHTGDTDIHITADERTAWNKVTDKIDKTSISTTIDSTSTDEQVASAKAVYDNIKYKYLPTLHNIDVLDYIVNNINKEGFYIFYAADDCTNTPRGNWTRMFVDYLSKTRIIVTGVDIRSVNNTYEYKNTMIDKWSGWKKVCTTSVKDVPKTIVNYDTNVFSQGGIVYEVINGICYVTIMGLKAKSIVNNYEISSIAMPKPKYGVTTCPIVCDGDGSVIGMFYVDVNFGTLPKCHMYNNVKIGYCSFSYPVAES